MLQAIKFLFALTLVHNGHALTDNANPLDKNITYYRAEVRRDPTDCRNYYGLSVAYEQMGKYDEALAARCQAIRLFPSVVPLSTRTCDLYGGSGNFDSTIRNDSKLALAYLNRGIALLARGNCSRAMSDFNKAILLDPSQCVCLSKSVPCMDSQRKFQSRNY